jgi:hypothetical protein
MAIMPSRDAACSCGQLRLTADGDPVRISMCHCLACQRRTGSGVFADPTFPAPTVSVWEERRHPWLALPAAMEHHD